MYSYNTEVTTEQSIKTPGTNTCPAHTLQFPLSFGSSINVAVRTAHCYYLTCRHEQTASFALRIEHEQKQAKDMTAAQHTCAESCHANTYHTAVCGNNNISCMSGVKFMVD